MARETKDIVAIDIIRIGSRLSRAEKANKISDKDAAIDALVEVAGLAMNLASLLRENRT